MSRSRDARVSGLPPTIPRPVQSTTEQKLNAMLHAVVALSVQVLAFQEKIERPLKALELRSQASLAVTRIPLNNDSRPDVGQLICDRRADAPGPRGSAMTVVWNKCNSGNDWCPFMAVNLSHQHSVGMEGVYIIWQSGAGVVYVGQGQIAARLQAHRTDTRITPYENLLVTWAQVVAQYRDGVERFLTDRLNPKVSERRPAVPQVPVNLPW